MGYAIGDRRLCHFERFFYSVGTIIEPGQDVTVQIDHSSPPLSPPGTERLPGAQRKQNSGENLPHPPRSEEHTSELQSLTNLVCRLLLEKKKKINYRQLPG